MSDGVCEPCQHVVFSRPVTATTAVVEEFDAYYQSLLNGSSHTVHQKRMSGTTFNQMEHQPIKWVSGIGIHSLAPSADAPEPQMTEDAIPRAEDSSEGTITTETTEPTEAGQIQPESDEHTPEQMVDAFHQGDEHMQHLEAGPPQEATAPQEPQEAQEAQEATAPQEPQEPQEALTADTETVSDSGTSDTSTNTSTDTQGIQEKIRSLLKQMQQQAVNASQAGVAGVKKLGNVVKGSGSAQQTQDQDAERAVQDARGKWTPWKRKPRKLSWLLKKKPKSQAGR